MTKLIIWHDGACLLCRREIALMRRLDRRGAIEFIDVAMSDDAACPLDRTPEGWRDPPNSTMESRFNQGAMKIQ